MRQVVLATGNSGKISELKALLQPAGWEILAKPVDLEVEETGTSFDENACIKALRVAKLMGTWALADDSGLEVDALDGAPGVYSARYGSNDTERIRRLLDELRGKTNRGARFVCAVALATPERVLLTVEGICEGKILSELRGTGGFGYDPVFWVPGLGKTFAELTAEEKATVSHRGRAMAALLVRLPTLN